MTTGEIRRARPSGDMLILVTPLLASGGVARFAGPLPTNILWAVADAVALVPATLWVVADLRTRRYGADLLALSALLAHAKPGTPAARRGDRDRPHWTRTAR